MVEDLVVALLVEEGRGQVVVGRRVVRFQGQGALGIFYGLIKIFLAEVVR